MYLIFEKGTRGITGSRDRGIGGRNHGIGGYNSVKI